MVAALAVGGIGVAGAASEAASPLPTPTYVSAADLGGGEVSVTWDRISGSGSYQVALSADKETSYYGWFSPGTTGVTMTLTGDVRAVASSGVYYVRVRARRLDDSDHSSDSGASAYSPWFTVDAESETIPRYKVGNYNIMCTTNCQGSDSATIDTFPWVNREARVLKDIRDLDLDVIGLQEDNNPIATEWGCANKVQGDCKDPKNGDASKFLLPQVLNYKDTATALSSNPSGTTTTTRDDGLELGDYVAARLAPDGYVDTLAPYPTRSSRFPEGHILYKSSKFTATRSGAFTDLYSGYVPSSGRSYAEWVILQDKARPTASVVVVNVHPVASSSAGTSVPGVTDLTGDQARARYMTNLVKQLDVVNSAKLPVVMVGDFNSPTSADGGLTYLRGKGFKVADEVAVMKMHPTFKSYTGFQPDPVHSSYPYDHVVFKDGGTAKVQAVASWVVAKIRVASDGTRWEDNCLGWTNQTLIAKKGCIGSDHVPEMASLRW